MHRATEAQGRALKVRASPYALIYHAARSRQKHGVWLRILAVVVPGQLAWPEREFDRYLTCAARVVPGQLAWPERKFGRPARYLVAGKLIHLPDKPAAVCALSQALR